MITINNIKTEGYKRLLILFNIDIPFKKKDISMIEQIISSIISHNFCTEIYFGEQEIHKELQGILKITKQNNQKIKTFIFLFNNENENENKCTTSFGYAC